MALPKAVPQDSPESALYVDILLFFPGGPLRGYFPWVQSLMFDASPQEPEEPVISEMLLAYLRKQKREGKRLILVGKASSSMFEVVHERVPLFEYDDIVRDLDQVKRTNPWANYLTGQDGVHQLNGALVFDGRTVQPTEKLEIHGRFLELAKGARPYQWVKNILLFLPLFLAHELSDPEKWINVFLAFCAFSLCASGVYYFNDLLDLSADRKHPIKSRRPLASGLLPVSWVLVAIPLFLGAGLVLGGLVSAKVALLLGLYLVLNVAYSFRLKWVLFADVVTLACFYALRIFVGGVAVQVEVSPWMIAFSIFLFLSLALVKRVSELVQVVRAGNASQARAYLAEDLIPLVCAGIGSGYLSVLVFSLYINGEHVRSLYESPNLLWGICVLLLFWVSRLWILAHRGRVNADPILFALKDRATYWLAPLTAAIWLLAWGAINQSLIS